MRSNLTARSVCALVLLAASILVPTGAPQASETTGEPTLSEVREGPLASAPSSTSNPSEPSPSAASSPTATSSTSESSSSTASSTSRHAADEPRSKAKRSAGTRERPRREAHRAKPSPRRGLASVMSLSVGNPNDGSQERAKRLRPSPHLAILERSKGRTYGHPSLVLMLQRSAKHLAKSFPGSKLVVGDLSLERGGPLSGHHSHQSGRDADVAFYARDARGRSVELKSYVAFDTDGKAKDGSGLVFDDERNYRLVETWARDSRATLSYVFVSRPLKARLLAWGEKHAKNRELLERMAALFLQPENAEPHDDHFHVRVRCPSKQEGICIESPK